ncbi:hypothetical protein [Streptomyces sp. NPDC057939]|uniref:hypothetical protein n=1 Tax=Streptomyces sp. NPDC057939 TaxID=3346284 RepID=UPI0036ECD2C4
MMFIRPVGPTVTAATRSPGHPLLQGLLRRASGAAEWTQGEEREREREREEWERTGWGEGAAGTEGAAGAAGAGDIEGAADAIADLEGDAAAWGMGAREAGTGRTDAADAAAGAGAGAAGGAAGEPQATRAAAAAGGPPGATAQERTPTAQPGLAAELTQLAALAREGLLTPQEFTTAKSKLLRG